MKSEDKRAYWQEHISGWQKGGSSQKEYCKQQDLKLSSFTYWRSRLAAAKPGNKLIPVMVSTAQAVTFTFPGGLQLDVPIARLDQVLPMILRTSQGVD